MQYLSLTLIEQLYSPVQDAVNFYCSSTSPSPSEFNTYRGSVRARGSLQHFDGSLNPLLASLEVFGIIGVPLNALAWLWFQLYMGFPEHRESKDNSQLHRKNYDEGIFHSVNFTVFEVRKPCARFEVLTNVALKLLFFAK
jgi:hypothetical protein